MQVPFDNTYVKLPERFYSKQLPSPVAEPGVIRINDQLADFLGIDSGWLRSEEGLSTVAGNHLPEGADPIATVYAGHQFGSWNPQLGDGRAILLGEVIGKDDQRYDLQLKGAGQTPYSRMGDGRAPLGPVLREYLVSEAMHAFGVRTSRALAAVTTGEPVYREESLPGAVIARVASSHIRIGTVQFFASRQDNEALGLLVDHTLQRHYPGRHNADMTDSEKALALLDEVMRAQAELVASWQMVGFVHGVMNTDNMLLSGETIDYGPCAFMDTYNPEAVFSSIDHGGRYAYRNQPGIAHWNVACLAQALVPVISDDEEVAVEAAKDALEQFPPYFLEANIAGLRKKFGLITENEDDESLAKAFLDLLEAHQLDFTLSFRRLSELAGEEPELNISKLGGFPSAFDDWMNRWQARCQEEQHPERQVQMLGTNPVMIPRNHLIEEAIQQASENESFESFHLLVDQLETPFSQEGKTDKLLKRPRPEEVVRQTFCGT
ncbi:MAG: YdiU family protein [Pseudomonadales bacterium]|nr:YdiU family protein [Pseudomonadales bacterium]MBO6564597.1 YdiU family protein [Pseudomonadales bacterium]MBO6596871.1 YdiU family protein [Pseudomonadales bacterium]MBO6703542.1 YdiU family protein [Pseudomonadales bacterium]MBO6823140.1 YdiU family protein [Pseudomonadales bacterium]